MRSTTKLMYYMFQYDPVFFWFVVVENNRFLILDSWILIPIKSQSLCVACLCWKPFTEIWNYTVFLTGTLLTTCIYKQLHFNWILRKQAKYLWWVQFRCHLKRNHWPTNLISIISTSDFMLFRLSKHKVLSLLPRRFIRGIRNHIHQVCKNRGRLA